MEELVTATVRGVAQGSLYALLGLGFVIVYKGTRVVNFAQPVLMILGAYFPSAFAVDRGVPFPLAALAAIAATALVAIAVERIAMRPMVGQPPFAAAMVTVGVFLALQVVAGDLIGLEQRQVGDPWGLDQSTIAGVSVFHNDVARIAIAIAVVGALGAFFKYSRWGLAIRATAFSQETSLAQGVPVGRMFALSWALAGMLAAIAGMLVGTGGGGIGQSTPP